MSNKEQLIKNLRDLITGRNSEELEEKRGYAGRGEDGIMYRRTKSGEKEPEQKYLVNKHRGQKTQKAEKVVKPDVSLGRQGARKDMEANMRSQIANTPRKDRPGQYSTGGPNRHQRRRKGEESVEEATAGRRTPTLTGYEITRREKSGRNPLRPVDYQGATRYSRGTDRKVHGIDSQNSDTPRLKPNRHARKRMGGESVEEATASRTAKLRSRKSGERSIDKDNSKLSKQTRRLQKGPEGTTTDSPPYRLTGKGHGLSSQNAATPRGRANRHARKRMGEGYYWSNVDLGYAISEALGHGVKAAFQKVKEVYTKGTKRQQERGIAQANKEAEKNAAARRNN